MNNKLRLIDYIQHIQQYAEEALSFVEDFDENSFSLDRKTQQAVVANLMTIGEIGTLLTKNHPDFIKATSDIPWQDITGMRHRLIHGYNTVSVGRVWSAVTTHLPNLLKSIPLMINVERQFSGKGNLPIKNDVTINQPPDEPEIIL